MEEKREIDDALARNVRHFYPRLTSREVPSKAREIRDWCEKQAVQIVPTKGTRLSQTLGQPEVLYVRGNADLIHLYSIAVVGTRRPSHYGLRASYYFSYGLSQKGFVIVSGLAQGIDRSAHLAALATGGFTTAVLGHGMDRIYPSENRSLAENIVKNNGCLVTEYPPGIPPLKHHFPARNRIISGLSMGVIIVEAALGSGSLITARHCLDQGRELFVIPGTFQDQHFAGSHKLIQQGAKLSSTLDDVLEEMSEIRALFVKRPPSAVESTRDDLLSRAFEKAGGSATLSDLFYHSKLPLADLASRLDRSIAAGDVMEIQNQTYGWVQRL